MQNRWPVAFAIYQFRGYFMAKRIPNYGSQMSVALIAQFQKLMIPDEAELLACESSFSCLGQRSEYHVPPGNLLFHPSPYVKIFDPFIILNCLLTLVVQITMSNPTRRSYLYSSTA